MKTRRPFWNKIRKHKLKFIVVLTVAIIASVSFYFVIGQGKLRSDEVEKPVNQNDESTNNKVSTAQLGIPPMPVMMYHYIRNLNDPNDKIGTNLSVSPEKFASELDLIKSKGYTTITFEDLEANKIPEKAIILTFDDGYKDFYQNAYPELKKRNMKAVSFIITNKIDQNEYMNSDEIKEISNYGIEIGSHTLSHPDLSKLSSEKTKKEIEDSKKILEDLIGKDVISFCYPSGKYTSDTEKLVETAGYKYAVTTNGGITSFNDNFALNRYRVNPDTNIGAFLK